MGWDAYAVGYVETLHQKDFDKAIKRILRKGQYADAGLTQGYLDCTPCAKAMEEITGVTSYGEGYSHQSLLYIEDKINRAKHEPDSEVELWAFYSAQEFLKICIKHKLGIKFSW